MYGQGGIQIAKGISKGHDPFIVDSMLTSFFLHDLFKNTLKESKDIREPNKVKSIQPLIFHFLMFKVRNPGCEYTDFFNFSRGNFWCIPCLDIQLNSTLQPAITKFFCCLVGSPIYKASLFNTIQADHDYLPCLSMINFHTFLLDTDDLQHFLMYV